MPDTPSRESISKLGLVLNAGGARGAYQAGVLARLGELPIYRDDLKPGPFQILSGASAGAINATLLASGAPTFGRVTRRLAALWSELTIPQVFRADALSLGLRSGRWLKDLTLGGLVGGGSAQSLLDATPLRKLLKDHCPVEHIDTSIRQGALYALAVSATSYLSGKSYTFVQGAPGHPLWQKDRRVSLATPIGVDHVWASCAIPMVFQSVPIDVPGGVQYFGDGALRLTHPLSPAIRLGADRVLAIGIRCQRAAEARAEREYVQGAGAQRRVRPPSTTQVIGVCLNSIFLDHLDTDLQHLERLNRVVAVGSGTLAAGTEALRPVSALALYPSVDLAEIADQLSARVPRLVSYFLEGLGSSRADSADLLSYLLFDHEYTRTLIELGRRDADARIDELEAFIRLSAS